MSWQAPQASLLPDGRRLHLHHGPIDLIIEVFGTRRQACYAQAVDRFQTVLTGLVSELDALRRPVTDAVAFADPVARRMADVAAQHTGVFVTPMAAVAGAVADEVLSALIAGQTPTKAYVNNGGDIAFYLTEGQSFAALSPVGNMHIAADEPSRGIATSGWQGRSQSLGIADAVTVAAKTAAAADIAATLIANSVDLPGHPLIRRSPANLLNPDSDLGARAVTTHVGSLSRSEIATALQAGAATARSLCARGLIDQAALSLQGQSVLIPNTAPLSAPPVGDLTHA